MTPIEVFEELGDLVYRLKGQTMMDIAEGLRHLIRDAQKRTKIVETATNWLEAHYALLARRFNGMVLGLLNNATEAGTDF